jgi:TonB family protein
MRSKTPPNARRKCSAAAILFLAAASFASAQDASSPTAPPPSAAPGATVAGVISHSGGAPPTELPKPVRIAGNLEAAMIVHQVQPVYPLLAKTAHVSGTVVLDAIIEKDGRVGGLTYVSGPPLLMQAAMDAVKQWKYKPTTLNGSAVRVDTTVKIVFTWGDGSSDTSVPAAASGGNERSGAQEVKIDPEFRADILHLLEVTHSMSRGEDALRKVFESMRPMLVKSLPPTPNRDKIIETYGDKFSAILKSKEFEDDTVKLYAEHLTPADVKTAIKFYETPEGQHYLEGTQNMMSELMDLGQRMAAKNLPTILSDLCKQYPELQGEAKFCPAPDAAPKSELRLPAPAAPSGN